MIVQTYPASGRCNATVRSPCAWMCLDVEGGCIYLSIHLSIFWFEVSVRSIERWIDRCIRDFLTLELPVVPQLRPFFFFFSITLGLELSDTKVYEP